MREIIKRIKESREQKTEAIAMAQWPEVSRAIAAFMIPSRQIEARTSFGQIKPIFFGQAREMFGGIDEANRYVMYNGDPKAVISQPDSTQSVYKIYVGGNTPNNVPDEPDFGFKYVEGEVKEIIRKVTVSSYARDHESRKVFAYARYKNDFTGKEESTTKIVWKKDGTIVISADNTNVVIGRDGRSVKASRQEESGIVAIIDPQEVKNIIRTATIFADAIVKSSEWKEQSQKRGIIDPYYAQVRERRREDHEWEQREKDRSPHFEGF